MIKQMGRPKMEYEGLIDRLKELRKKHKYSQVGVRKALMKKFNINISKSAFPRWEQGVNTPCEKSFHILSKLFGVSVDYLKYGDGGFNEERPSFKTVEAPLVPTVDPRIYQKFYKVFDFEGRELFCFEDHNELNDFLNELVYNNKNNICYKIEAHENGITINLLDFVEVFSYSLKKDKEVKKLKDEISRISSKLDCNVKYFLTHLFPEIDFKL